MKNIFRFASLLAAAVMLFACEPQSKDPLDDSLFQLRADKDLVKANGQDTVKFKALYDQVDVTQEIAIYYKEVDGDGAETVLDGVAFTSAKEGFYKFWAEYEDVSDTLTVMATADGKMWDISMSVDRDVIHANSVDYAQFTVLLHNRYDVTSDAKLYDEKAEELTHDAGKFTTDKAGEYNIYAEYGTSSTFDKKAENKGMIAITAIPVAVPDVAEDAQADNTSFVHRAFLTQYTGLACGYCPYMITILKQIEEDGYIPGKAVLAAVHSYSNADPAYIAQPKVANYPYLTVDLVQGFSHSQSNSVLKNLIDETVAAPAKAGISVNPALYQNEGLLVVRVEVKAAEAGLYKVGAWLLEDGIIGVQNDYDGLKKAHPEYDYDTHESCVRIADSRYDGRFDGFPLGELKAGETVSKTFVMELKSAWKAENLHLAVFVSNGKVSGKAVSYSVCNVVDAPLDAPTPYEYK